MSSLWNFLPDNLMDDEETQPVQPIRKVRRRRAPAPKPAVFLKPESPTVKPDPVVVTPPMRRAILRPPKVVTPPKPDPSASETASRPQVLRALLAGHYSAKRLIAACPDLKPAAVYAALFELRQAGLITALKVELGDGFSEWREVADPERAAAYLKQHAAPGSLAQSDGAAATEGGD